MSTFEKIDLLCSLLGINLELEHMKYNNKYEYMYYARFLSYDIYCQANPLDFKTIDSAYFFNQLWFNHLLCFNNYELNYVLECLIASNSFKIACEKDVYIGNPFYKKFGLINCKCKDEFKIILDLFCINDISAKNIYDVKKILKV